MGDPCLNLDARVLHQQSFTAPQNLAQKARASSSSSLKWLYEVAWFITGTINLFHSLTSRNARSTHGIHASRRRCIPKKSEGKNPNWDGFSHGRAVPEFSLPKMGAWAFYDMSDHRDCPRVRIWIKEAHLRGIKMDLNISGDSRQLI